MSEAGITVYNSNNIIQIDGTYKNLYLSQKIPLNGTGTRSGSFIGGEVVAAVGGTTSSTIDAYCVNTPTGWTCTVNTFVSGMCVYVFSTQVTETTHGVGLQVFNGNREIVYDSNNRHPIVVGFGQHDGYAFAPALRPAVAVCQERKTEYIQAFEETGFEQIYETRNVYHDAVYGWVEEQYDTYEYVPDQYEWVAGHYENQYVAGHYENQYVAGSYQYNPFTGQYEWTSGGYQNVWVPGGYQSVWVPAEYKLITPAHTEFVTKTRTVYKEIKPGYWETIGEWVTYYCEYETPYYKYSTENFRLTSGKITSVTLQEGVIIGEVYQRRLIRKESVVSGTGQHNEFWGRIKSYKSVVVDTRSWLMFDVKDL